MEAFTKNEINLADIGFPVKKTGAKPRGKEVTLLNAIVILNINFQEF